MKATFKQSPPARLEIRDDALCIVMEAPFDSGLPNAGGAALRQWFRGEECDADPTLVGGRPGRTVDSGKGLFVDDGRDSYRLADAGEAKPIYAEVVSAQGGSEARPTVETDDAGRANQHRLGNGAQANGKRQRNGREKKHVAGGTDETFSEEPPVSHQLNL